MEQKNKITNNINITFTKAICGISVLVCLVMLCITKEWIFLSGMSVGMGGLLGRSVAAKKFNKTMEN